MHSSELEPPVRCRGREFNGTQEKHRKDVHHQLVQAETFAAAKGNSNATLKAHLLGLWDEPGQALNVLLGESTKMLPLAVAASHGKVPTQRDQDVEVLQHHLPVQDSLCRVQAQPLIPAEGHGHIPECHRLL